MQSTRVPECPAMQKLLCPILIATMLLGSCSEHDRPTDATDYLAAAVDTPLIPLANLDVASADNLRVVGEGDARYLGLAVLNRQAKVHGGNRAEISVDFPFVEGQTVRYEWRFMLPAGFAFDEPLNRWCVIGQWHDQPDPGLSETWDAFPARSPPILLGIGSLDGSPGVALVYGPDQPGSKQETVGVVPLTLGRWHQLSMTIHWSRSDTGKAVLQMDDMSKPLLTASGPNMNNAYQHYFKVGLYRHPDISTDNWIYVDDIHIRLVEEDE